jgi:hypothetical protein
MEKKVRFEAFDKFNVFGKLNNVLLLLDSAAMKHMRMVVEFVEKMPSYCKWKLPKTTTIEGIVLFDFDETFLVQKGMGKSGKVDDEMDR